MNTNLKIAAGLAAVLVVAVVGYRFLPGASTGFGSPTPTPTPTAIPSPSPSSAASPPRLTDGVLTAGDYVIKALADDPMSYTVTVPKGWEGFGGWALTGPATNSEANGIGLGFFHDPLVTVVPCGLEAKGPSPAPSVRSVDALVASLSARPDLKVSGVTDTELDGHPGKRLDIELPAQLSCSNHYVFSEPQGFWAQGPGNLWRVWILDADGGPAVIVLEDFAGTSDGDRAAGQGIVDSVRITP
jgi:hypothetical protein